MSRIWLVSHAYSSRGGDGCGSTTRTTIIPFAPVKPRSPYDLFIQTHEQLMRIDAFYC